MEDLIGIDVDPDACLEFETASDAGITVMVYLMVLNEEGRARMPVGDLDDSRETNGIWFSPSSFITMSGAIAAPVSGPSVKPTMMYSYMRRMVKFLVECRDSIYLQRNSILSQEPLPQYRLAGELLNRQLTSTEPDLERAPRTRLRPARADLLRGAPRHGRAAAAPTGTPQGIPAGGMITTNNDEKNSLPHNRSE